MTRPGPDLPGQCPAPPLQVLLRRPLQVGLWALTTVAGTSLAMALVVLLVFAPQVDRARQMLDALQDGHTAMLNQETGLRGFLVTRDARFLEPYEKGAADLGRSDALLQQLALEEPALAARFAELRAAEWRFVDEWADPLLAAPPPMGDTAALSRLLREGKVLFDEYRIIETEVRSQVAEQRERVLDLQRTVLLGGAVLSVVVAGLVAVAVRRANRRLTAELLPPTQQVRDTLASLTAGELDSRATASGPLELRDIADDVNSLGEALRDRNELVQARERELVHARDEAERAGQAKTAFLATMSHEIRTPLNAVLGLTDLLLRTDLSDDQRSHLDTIARSGDSLLTLINDVLDFSKIEAGELDLESAPFDLDALVYDVAQLLGPQAAAKGLDLLVDVPADRSWRLLGDAARLRQVVLNLVGNAVKFTASGQVLITVDGAVTGDRMSVRLSVADTGIGISTEQRHRLFRSFSQGDTSITRSHGGTGLGLAISQRIVAALGGAITVESQAGAGSTFVVALELEVAPVARQQRRTAPLAGCHLLVVDDNPTNLRILEHQLTGFGATCVLAHDGTEAVAAVEGGARFDACLLDLHMPDMAGDELAALLSDHRATSGTPLLLLSSATGLPAAGRALFAARLHKPTRPDRLLGALLTVLDRGRGGPVDAAAAARAASGAVEVGAGPRALPVADGAARPLRILVAEDHEVNAHLIDLYLSQLGHDSDRVENGRAAVEAVQTQRYDVVLMDAQMPVMGGVEATAAIRRLPGEQPRIVAVTASVLAVDRTAFLAAGADDFLTKPVRLATLDEALRRLTELLPAAAPPVPAAAAASPATVPPVAAPAGAGGHAGDVLDAETVEELRDLGEEAFARLFEQYVDSLAETVDLLVTAADRSAFSEDDDGSVPRLAHRLEGSSAAMGALRLAEVCARLQAVGTRPSPDLELTLAELQDERVRVGDAVRTLFDDRRP